MGLITTQGSVVTGCGYTGARLCLALRKKGQTVTALVRNVEAAGKVASSGCGVRLLDLDSVSPPPLDYVTGSVLFHLVPPPSTGVVDDRIRHLFEGIKDALPARIILASTSGVYGNRDGAWVRESDALNPGTDRAKRRADAERQAREFGDHHDVPLSIIRIPGIYGPGRLPLDRLKGKMPLPSDEECGFTNRIHVDDLVTVLLAAAADGAPPGTFNVSDGKPSSTRKWFELVAEVAGLEAPPLITFDQAKETLSPAFLSFLLESRRLDVSKLANELQPRLKYENQREGIEASLAR